MSKVMRSAWQGIEPTFDRNYDTFPKAQVYLCSELNVKVAQPHIDQQLTA